MAEGATGCVGQPPKSRLDQTKVRREGKLMWKLTYYHPNCKSEPCQLVQGHHEVDIEEHGDERQQWYKRNFEVEFLLVLWLPPN